MEAINIIGFGIGNLSGGMDSAFTQVGIIGGDDVVNWLDRFATGYERVNASQEQANRSAQRYMNSLQRMGALSSITGRLGGFSFGQGAFSLGMSGASGSMIALGLASVKASNDVVESESLVAQVYGRNTQRIIDWSEQRRKALGVNSYDTRRVSAGFATQFEAAGMNPEKARELSQAFTEARDDLVSFYNVKDPNDAFRALQSGIAGEVEPLRRFSLFVSEAATKEYALRKGIVETNRELTDQEKVLSRSGLILEQFNRGKAKGDLQRTKDSPVNQWRRQQNELKMAQVEFGQALQPIQTDALKIANDVLPIVSKLVHNFASLDETTRRWVLGLGLAVGPLGWAVVKGKQLIDLFKTSPKGLPNLPGGKGGLFSNVGLMKVNAGSVLINGPVIGGGGLPGFPGGGVPRGPIPRGPLALPPGATGPAARALPGLSWQLRTLYGIGGAQAVLHNAPSLFQMHAPRALAARRAALPTAAGLGLAARSLTPWGLGLGVGLGGAEVIRHIQAGQEDARISKANDEDDKAVRSGNMTRQEARSRAAKRENERTTPDSFGEMAGNTGRRLLDVGKIGYSGAKSLFTGEEIRGWDETRGQFQSDSELQMKDASKKYQADVKAARDRANQWALKYHRSFEEADIRCWESIVELERHWAMQYAQNKSLSGYQRHIELKQQAQQNVTQSTLKYLDSSLDKWKDENRPGWRANEALGMDATQRQAKQSAQYNALKGAGHSDEQIAKEMNESAQGIRAREIARQEEYLKRSQTVMELVPGSRTGERRQVQRRLSQAEQQAELQKFIKQYDDEHGTGPKEKARPPIWNPDTAYAASLFGIGPKSPIKPMPSMANVFAQRMGMKPPFPENQSGAAAMGGGSSGLLGSVNESGNSTRIVEGEVSGVRGRDGTTTFEFRLPKVTIAPGPGDTLARDIEHTNRTPWMPMP